MGKPSVYVSVYGDAATLKIRFTYTDYVGIIKTI